MRWEWFLRERERVSFGVRVRGRRVESLFSLFCRSFEGARKDSPSKISLVSSVNERLNERVSFFRQELLRRNDGFHRRREPLPDRGLLLARFQRRDLVEFVGEHRRQGVDSRLQRRERERER